MVQPASQRVDPQQHGRPQQRGLGIELHGMVSLQRTRHWSIHRTAHRQIEQGHAQQEEQDDAQLEHAHPPVIAPEQFLRRRVRDGRRGAALPPGRALLLRLLHIHARDVLLCPADLGRFLAPLFLKHMVGVGVCLLLQLSEPAKQPFLLPSREENYLFLLLGRGRLLRFRSGSLASFRLLRFPR